MVHVSEIHCVETDESGRSVVGQLPAVTEQMFIIAAEGAFSRCAEPPAPPANFLASGDITHVPPAHHGRGSRHALRVGVASFTVADAKGKPRTITVRVDADCDGA